MDLFSSSAVKFYNSFDCFLANRKVINPGSMNKMNGPRIDSSYQPMAPNTKNTVAYNNNRRPHMNNVNQGTYNISPNEMEPSAQNVRQNTYQNSNSSGPCDNFGYGENRGHFNNRAYGQQMSSASTYTFFFTKLFISPFLPANVTISL